MSSTGVEDELVKELQALGKRKPLSKDDLARAKEIMVELKKRGYAVEEIADLSDGGWSSFSVKNYTKGTKPQDSTAKLNLASSMKELSRQGIPFGHVIYTVETMRKLDSMGLTIEDVSTMLTEAGKAKFQVGRLVSVLEEATDSGLSAAKLADALEFKRQLDASGVGFENAKLLADSAKNFGSIDNVLTAVNQYGSLQAIEDGIAKAETQKARLTKEVNDQGKKLEELKKKQAPIEADLRLYAELQAAGFDGGALKQLEKASAKYGGPRGTLEAVNAFDSLKDLKSSIVTTTRDLRDLTTQLKQLKADWAQMTSVVKMAETMLYTYKFGPDDIAKVHKMAKLFGEPAVVLDAISEYGKMQNLQAEVENLRSKKSALESRLFDLEAELQKTRGLMHDMAEAIREALKPLAGDVKDTIQQINSEVRQAGESIGALRAKADQLGTEVRLAQMILAADRFPDIAKNLSADNALVLLGGVGKLLRAKGLNPKFKIPKVLAEKYWSYTDREFETLDLLDWLYVGLNSTLGA